MRPASQIRLRVRIRAACTGLNHTHDTRQESPLRPEAVRVKRGHEGAGGDGALITPTRRYPGKKYLT
ncbi:hypothetical protein E2C01_058637 [Portunus trituberculatus]|uniref:Uncharacterized protein n=1 Tax=Portunus trituberculatus TaxID=210409 RepID=A0A5B7H3J8_PORTR|nr:hypothetical protein [Portunus trituberculatus]